MARQGTDTAATATTTATARAVSAMIEVTHTENNKYCCIILFLLGNKCGTNKGKCIFPFIYKGYTYNGCTDAGNRAGVKDKWCATSIDTSGTMTDYDWCKYDCPGNCEEPSYVSKSMYIIMDTITIHGFAHLWVLESS